MKKVEKMNKKTETEHVPTQQDRVLKAAKWAALLLEVMPDITSRQRYTADVYDQMATHHFGDYEPEDRLAVVIEIRDLFREAGSPSRYLDLIERNHLIAK
jgi:hypothetical protein